MESKPHPVYPWITVLTGMAYGTGYYHSCARNTEDNTIGFWKSSSHPQGAWMMSVADDAPDVRIHYCPFCGEHLDDMYVDTLKEVEDGNT